MGTGYAAEYILHLIIYYYYFFLGRFGPFSRGIPSSLAGFGKEMNFCKMIVPAPPKLQTIHFDLLTVFIAKSFLFSKTVLMYFVLFLQQTAIISLTTKAPRFYNGEAK
jgi:hypothetical protein